MADSLNTQATGLEAALAFHIKDGIKTYLNYNFMLNKEPMVNAPAQLCKFGVLVPFLTHFYIYTEGQYEGERLRYNGDFTQASFLMNSNLGFRPRFESESLKWANHIKLAFRMYNIFNELYQHPVHPDLINTGMMPQNGRMWQTQLTIQF